MTPIEDGGAPRRALVALAATLGIQIYTSLAVTTTAVLAPAIAPAYGVSPTLVGVFVGLVYAGSMTGSLLAGGYIARHGAIRVSQACVLLCAVGIALLTLLAHPAAALVLAVIAPLIGIGYGPITAASSQVLARTAPPSRMALTFSIKQTGVPAGAALAGAILPALALTFGWRAAMFAVGATGVLVAVTAQSVRADLDRERGPQREQEGFLAPLRELVAEPRLLDLALMSFFYAATQVSLTSFLVVYLAEGLGHTLVTAGGALSVAAIAGVVGRIVWGGVADRTRSPRRVLIGLGVAAGLCALTTAAWPVGAPLVLLLVVLAIFGATAVGWNGVMLSEVARLAPAGRAGAVTGASGFVTFAGVVCGPTVFAFLAQAAGNYRVGFVAVGIGSLVGAIGLALRSRRHPPPAQTEEKWK